MSTYCEQLGIDVPSLEAVREHPEAKPFSLLIVALLERGGPMSLAEVARRFAQAGVAPEAEALASLKRCRPGRAPVHRDGELYELDPHDDELDLWIFILGLRPAKVPQLSVVRPEPEPLAGPEQALSVAELEEAFDEQYLGSAWSAQRLALAVLDAHGAPMAGEQVVAVLDRLAAQHFLKVDTAQYWRRNAAVSVEEDGRWTFDREHRAVRGMRVAVRERIEVARRHRHNEPAPAVAAACRKRFERQQAESAAELARLRRCLLHAFPPSAPAAAALIDVADREVSSFPPEDFDALRARLGGYELLTKRPDAPSAKMKVALQRLAARRGTNRADDRRIDSACRALVAR